HGCARSDSHQNSDGMTAKYFRVAEQNPGHDTEEHNRATEDHWFATTESIRDKAEQRTPNHPADWDGSGQCDCCFVFTSACLLQEAHAPCHAEDGRRNEEQTGNETAEKRLRIAKDFA